MTTIRKLLATLLLCGAAATAQAEIKASLDRDRVAVGEAVQLRLLRDSRGGDAPDLSALKADFDVVGSSSQTNVQFINGHLSQQSVTNITLMAKRAGQLRIPAITWNGETSTPLSLTVTDAAAGAPGDAGPQHVFLAATLDQKQPYVQGNVVLTVTIHTDVPVRQAALNFDGNNDIAVQQLGQDQQDAEEIKGRRYQVIRRRYLLQMQRSGEVTLPGPTLDALIEVDHQRDLFGGMLGGGSVRQLRLHGDDILLKVKPRPAGTSSQAWLPAEKLSLVASWRPEGASLQAGEPLTLHLKMDAVGLTAAQLPDLAAQMQLQLPDGVRAYPDQAKLETASKDARVTASREQDIALIATRPGRYTIAALRLNWWDTVSDTAQTLVLPERVLDVLPAAGATTNAAPLTTAPAGISPAPPVLSPQAVATPTQDPVWKWISLLLALLWFATLLLWAITTRRQRSKRPVPEAHRASTQTAADHGNAQKNFHRACRDHDPAAARRALLAWSRQVYNGQAPAGLSALAQKLGDPGLGALLMQLNRACYSGGDWNGDALHQALTRLPASTSASHAKPGLAPLY